MPVTISLKDEPASLTEEQTEEKQRLLASYALLRKDVAGARLQLDTLLAAYPDNIGGLGFLARLLAATGDTAGARTALERALDVVYSRFPAPEEPPESLLLLQDALDSEASSIPIFASVNADVLTLRWPALPGASYSLESSPDLRLWQSRETTFVENAGVFSWTSPLTPDTQFFRLKAR